MNHKKVQRVYREEWLWVRTKRRLKHVSQTRARPPAAAPRERWSMDFVADGLIERRRVRIFAAIDNHTRECVCLVADYTMASRTVTAAFDGAIATNEKRETITCDNGTEFTSTVFDAWAHQAQIEIAFITPGKPTENGLIETFNGPTAR